jgi:mono/diheme cytochrome c family protein
MSRLIKVGFLVLVLNGAVASALAAPQALDVDARRGAGFFQQQGCVNCHALKGVGPTVGPDLGRRLDRDYTPAGIAARMWNHAPVMWAAMATENVPIPRISTDQAADLFAYFYAARYFEKLSDGGRGKQLFQEKRCTECHSLTASGSGVGPPVEKWESLQSPILLIQHMWNHQMQMHNAMAARGISWPQLSSQDLDDMLLYLQNLPQTREKELFIQLPPPAEGERLFREKGCAECHKGKLALENRLSDSTLTDVAAAMWNHAPRMRQPPPELTSAEWGQLISYIWAKQFFATKGNAASGRRIFNSKNCLVCHNDPSSGAPSLSKPAEPYSAISIVSVLWRHGPLMMRKMQEKQIAWPQLSQDQMANLIAYLNSR